jgi:Flp pilus assembly protein TadG
MRKRLPELRREEGQALFLMVGLISGFLVLGAIAVDFGMWYSERRGAQKDADAASLAGAQAYLTNLTDTAGAFTQAQSWAVKNGVSASKIDTSSTTSCSSGNSCIATGTAQCRNSTDSMPWVETRIRHVTPSNLSRLTKGSVGPDVGALARACVGSPRGAENLSPFGVQTGLDASGNPLSDCLAKDPADPTKTIPVYGKVCILKGDAGNGVAGQRGQLTLGTSDCTQKSANTLKHDFHYGTKSECLVGNKVNTGTGTIVGLLQGLNDRLKEEGLCDKRFSTGHPLYDDFNEVFNLAGGGSGPVVPSASNVFVENQCSVTTGKKDDFHTTTPVGLDTFDGDTHTFTPRAVTLVLIDQLCQGCGGTATITGFAGFYVIGCVKDAQAAATKTAIEANLANTAAFLNRCDSPTGQDDILGIFVKTVTDPLNVGDPDPRLPLSIVLVK